MNKYNAVLSVDTHGLSFHSQTGEEAKPEEAYCTSETEEENEDLGFIHDNALDINTEIW